MRKTRLLCLKYLKWLLLDIMEQRRSTGETLHKNHFHNYYNHDVRLILFRTFIFASPLQSPSTKCVSTP
uniref:Uncharacterized protein n=1 Tax=Octopus bimaculoides TaxID=37653 RepID=A0A0L8I4A7_OCTBM